MQGKKLFGHSEPFSIHSRHSEPFSIHSQHFHPFLSHSHPFLSHSHPFRAIPNPFPSIPGIPTHSLSIPIHFEPFPLSSIRNHSNAFAALVAIRNSYRANPRHSQPFRAIRVPANEFSPLESSLHQNSGCCSTFCKILSPSHF